MIFELNEGQLKFVSENNDDAFTLGTLTSQLHIAHVKCIILAEPTQDSKVTVPGLLVGIQDLWTFFKYK